MNIEQEVFAVNSTSLSANSFAEKSSATITPNGDSRSHVTQLVREGITAAKAGNLPVAREILLNALELDNRHETALMWLASISDKPHELLGYLQQVLAVNPANERAMQWAKATKLLLAKSLIQQGAASHKEGMPEIAAQYFLQATEYEPTSEMAWLWLVSVAAEPEDKLSYLNRVLSLNPTHEKALALFHRTKTQIARSLLKKGNAAAVAGDRETAREILRDVMEYNSNLEEAWLLKAFLSDSSGEKAGCFTKALEINPESTQAAEGLEILKTQTDTAQPATEMPTPEPAVVTENYSQRLSEVATAETKDAEDFVEDDTVAPQFVADHFVAVESVDETSVEEDLTREQISAVANLPSDFSSTLAPRSAVAQTQTENSSPAQQFSSEFQEQSQEAIFAENPVAEAKASEPVAETTPEILAECQFCHAANGESAFRCQSCGAFVRLEKFEQLLANELNDEERMRGFIENWQTKSAESVLAADDCFNLGLAYVNLRNVKKAASNFEQFLNLQTGDQNRSAQIKSFLAYVNEKTPEALGNGVPASGKTILVVDDSPTVRKLIVGKLEKHGHRVVAAVDGMDALSKINENVPDLILLDVTMPRLDGYQLCKLVKANAKTKHVPVVMISGKDGFFDKVRGRMAGSTAYITKPFGPETLLQTVENYCS